MCAEITKFRHGMWAQVASRSHRPRQSFAFSEGADDLMAYGTLRFEFKDARKETADWGAYCQLTKADGLFKMDSCQVYLVRRESCPWA
jgi:hypothetical protein